MEESTRRRGKVAIIGAGPAGTTLALGLLQEGYRVTLVSERTADEIRAGSVMSSQITFESALAVEASLGIPPLLPDTARIARLDYDIVRNETVIAFSTSLSVPALSVDQRIKVPRLLEAIEHLGGTVEVLNATVADVDDLAQTHDLVIVSTGRGGLASLFEVDAERSPYTSPQRVISLTYLRGVELDPRGPALRYHCIEGVGECFTVPAVTTSGPCDIYVVEGVPGGPLDCWDGLATTAEHVERLQTVLAEHFPQESARVLGARATDPGAVLTGLLTPVVRRPVGTLPSGRPVLGMADVVVLNDPLTSQGSNNAIKSASFYLEAILGHEGAFDVAWMQRTFDNFWRGWAQWASDWTNAWLRPVSDYQCDVLSAAAEHPTVAAQIAAGFDDARLFAPWWFSAAEARSFLERQIALDDARFDPRDLRQALGQYATGVTVVTTEDAEGNRWGMTANSFTAVSLDPPIVLWAASKASPSMPAFESATHFVVNVLASDQHHLSRQFSTSGGDKFDGVTLISGDDVANADRDDVVHPPILDGTVAHFVCRTTQRVDVGDHVVLFGQIESYQAPGGAPLVFHSGSYRLTTKHPDL